MNKLRYITIAIKNSDKECSNCHKMGVYATDLCHNCYMTERHNAGKECRRKGCKEKVYKKGYCKKHCDIICKYPGCTKIVYDGDYCKSHEHLNGKICSWYDGCNELVYKKYLCKFHYERVAKDNTCDIEGCDKPIRARGLCASHASMRSAGVGIFRNFRKTGKFSNKLKQSGVKNSICDVIYCDKIATVKGFCAKHYHELRRIGGKICKIDGCSNVVYRKGKCKEHQVLYCKEPNCDEIATVKGFCAKHYYKKKRKKKLRNLPDAPRTRRDVLKNEY